MNEVAKIEDATSHTLPSGAVMVTQSAAFLQMIERASRDPAIDIVKFQALMTMKREIEAEAAKREYINCMAAAQAEISPVVKDSENSQTRSTYASYFALDEVVRPIYTKHGFSLSFYPSDGAPENYVRINCDVAHCSGHIALRYIDMPADGKGAKGGEVMTRTHATGSATKYGMRYLLTMIFNIATRDRTDDDGNAAGNVDGGLITDEQVSEVNRLLRETKSDLPIFLKHFGVGGIPEIRAKQLPTVLAKLEAKRASMTKEAANG